MKNYTQSVYPLLIMPIILFSMDNDEEAKEYLKKCFGNMALTSKPIGLPGSRRSQITQTNTSDVNKALEEGEEIPYFYNSSKKLTTQVQKNNLLLISKYQNIRSLFPLYQSYYALKQKAIRRKIKKDTASKPFNFRTMLNTISNTTDHCLLHGQENSVRKASVLEELILLIPKKTEKYQNYIRQNTSCSVCQEDYENKPQVNFCSKGHSLCLKCFNHPTLESCPECRDDFTPAKYSFCQQCCISQETTAFIWCQSCKTTTISCAGCDILPCCKVNKSWSFLGSNYEINKLQNMSLLRKQFIEHYQLKCNNQIAQARLPILKELQEKNQHHAALTQERIINRSEYEKIIASTGGIAKDENEKIRINNLISNIRNKDSQYVLQINQVVEEIKQLNNQLTITPEIIITSLDKQVAGILKKII